MGEISKIEWTEATWNPWHGCRKVSQGCKNCYMFRDKVRYGQDPTAVVRSKTTFYNPLKWTEPRTIFTCSWSDFFIEEADAWRDEAFAIMALTPQHTYQVLTKRPDRMLEYIRDKRILNWTRIYQHIMRLMDRVGKTQMDIDLEVEWPLKNVHLGVSVEDQKTADERIPLLLKTPAAVRWLSMEPLLENVVFDAFTLYDDERGERLIDWIVAGGESGPDARPMHPDWLRSIRDQCTAASVPFFFKQWREWFPVNSMADDLGEHGDVKIFDHCGKLTGHQHDWDDYQYSVKIGKAKAGRILDGRTWDEMPEVSR